MYNKDTPAPESKEKILEDVKYLCFFQSFLEIPGDIFLVQGEARPEGIGNLSANWKGE